MKNLLTLTLISLIMYACNPVPPVVPATPTIPEHDFDYTFSDTFTHSDGTISGTIVDTFPTAVKGYFRYINSNDSTLGASLVYVECNLYTGRVENPLIPFTAADCNYPAGVSQTTGSMYQPLGSSQRNYFFILRKNFVQSQITHKVN